MCGVAAILGVNNSGVFKIQIKKMVSALHHRGPDDNGTWIGDGIALGHTRLSIIELSKSGSQPMLSADQRWVIAFNGEIYNHLDIRKSLTCAWRGNSDTETLLAGFVEWGFEETLKKCVGMFGIIAWDAQERVLFLARDRIGEKPLYYGSHRGKFYAASELKSIAENIDGLEIDKNALVQYFKYGYIPAPLSVWKGMKKLLPGHFMEVSQVGGEFEIKSKKYWQIEEFTAKKLNFKNDEEAVEALDSLFQQSIRSQLVSDVPLGAFLSGGIDSSLVVAVMQKLSPRPVKTFTIGFNEGDFDESTYALAVARHVGTDHTVLKLSPHEALSAINRVASVWDEPFADASQIPAFFLSELTRKSVTVALSGDGGDELFAGYNRHYLYGKINKIKNLVPRWITDLTANGATSIPPGIWDLIALPAGLIKPDWAKSTGEKIHKLARLMKTRGLQEYYNSAVTQCIAAEKIVVGSEDFKANEVLLWDAPEQTDPILQMQFLDLKNYLPDDIMVKVDRSGMAFGLETRAPFLDHRIVEFSLGLAPNLKVRSGQGKWIVRRVLENYVPKQIIDRPKAGFGVPLASWLRGPLREWAEDLLTEEKLKCDGILNSHDIPKKWREHLSGRRNWQHYLWPVLMFQTWRDKWHTKRGSLGSQP